MKIEVFYSNCLNASCDGGTWHLFLNKVVVDGKELDDKGEVAKLLARLEIEDSYEYYNDNPAVRGFPDPTVDVGGTVFRVQDLAGEASWDDGPLVRVEFDR